MTLFWIVFLLGILITIYSIFYLFPEPFFNFALRAQYRQAGLKKDSIEIDGHQIHYLVGGNGPPLVLLHGFGADKHHWPQVVRNLTNNFTVYAPDLPGFGESSQIESASYTANDQVERIGKFVDALGLRDIHIGGNSMGGYFAGLYAATHKDNVSSLWLLAPAGVLSAEPTEAIAEIESGSNPLLINNLESYDRLTNLCFSKTPYIPGPFRRCICARAMENHKFFEKLFADFISEIRPLEEALAGSSIPTLILWGDEDRLLHPSGASLLANAMSDARVKIMSKMGHIPMLERPVETEFLFMDFHQLNK